MVVLESLESFKRGTEKKIPFDAILDGVTESDPSVTDYIPESPEVSEFAAVRFSKRHSSSLHHR